MTRPPNSPLLLRDISDRLRALADEPETPAARAEVEAALGSKWQGVRVLAIRAIGRWGGKANKAWLVERAAVSGGATGFNRRPPTRWTRPETNAAAEALAPLLGPADVDWLLDLWFRGEGMPPALHGYVVLRMPSDPIERRVARELEALRAQPGEADRDAMERRRQAVVWVVGLRRLFPDREDLLRGFARGGGEAAEDARSFLAWEDRRTTLALRLDDEAPASKRRRWGRKGRL